MNQLSEKLPTLRTDKAPDAWYHLLGDEQETQSPIGGKSERLRLSTCYVVLITVACSFISGLIGMLAASSYWQYNTSSICTEYTSRGSPITEDIKVTFSTVQFNGSLLKENIYRQEASPEVDAAWSALGVDYRSVAVPEHLAQRVGLAPDQVKIKDKYGGGFPANVEGLHQLHCLNLVRQSLYYNFEYYYERGQGPFSNSDHILKKHVSHCLDTIRQQLMCTVDIGVLGQVWFQPSAAEYPEAYVDFNTKHVCRNFDAVRQWAFEHQITEDPPRDFLEPPKEGDRIYLHIP